MPVQGDGGRAGTAGPRVPLGALAGAIIALGALEALVLAREGVVPLVAAAVVASVTAPLLLARRAPLTGLVAVLGLLLLARAQGLTAGVVWPALLVSVAAFVSGLGTDPRRIGWLVPIGVAYVAVRALQPLPDAVILALAAARYTTAAAAGVLIRRRLERLELLIAERDALRRAIEAGPAEAVAAEQLRVWSAVQPRTDRVVAELPGHAELAARALRNEPEEAVRHLEAIRVLASDAFESMRATVGALNSPGPGVAPVAAVPPARAGRRGATAQPAPSLLAAICGLLVAGALAEQVVFELPGPAIAAWGVAATLGFVPLLAPRRPLIAAMLTGVVVLAASAAGVLGGPTTTQNFAGSLVVAVAGATASPRRGALALVAVVVGMLLGLWAEPDPWPPQAYAGLGLALAGAWGAGVLLRRVIADYRGATAESREAGAALDALERRAVLGERLRLAGELHDLVGHALTSIVVQAAGASAQAARGRPQAAAAIAALAGAADHAVQELARLARVLAIEPGVSEPGAVELQAIIAHARRTGQDVGYTLEGPVDDLPPEFGRSVQRILQEALTNAAKHAAGAPVEVSVRAAPGAAGVELDVVNGLGRTEVVGGGGLGLRSMRERAHRCGGALNAGPLPGGGWAVAARLGEIARTPKGEPATPFG